MKNLIMIVSKLSYMISNILRSINYLKNCNEKYILALSAFMIFTICTLMFASPALSQDYYDGYYLYLYNDGGDYPIMANPGWHEEAQGITHDENNWYITQTWALWKISVELDLANPGVPNNTSGLYMINIANVPALTDEGYNHFGDLTYYEYDGTGYLLVLRPISSDYIAGNLKFENAI